MKFDIEKSKYPPKFYGAGFHNSDAGMYKLISEDFFNEILCKCYREISPGFSRWFGGYSDWSEEVMDDVASYYEKMQKWTDTPIYMVPGRGKIHFSDAEIEKYCDDVAEKMEYLIKKKGVKHAKFYCFSNELSQVSWGHLINDLDTFAKYQKGLYRAFQKRNLDIGLLATDQSGVWTSIDWAIDNIDVITKDYCVHWYDNKYALDDNTFYDECIKKFREYVEKCGKHQKHLFLAEFGITEKGNLKLFPNGSASDVCEYYVDGRSAKCCLKIADMIISAVNAGIYALGYWTFIDYPDPMEGPSFSSDEFSTEWTKYEPYLGGGITQRYNRWGLIPFEGKGRIRDSFWCLGILIKYLKRNSYILQIKEQDADTKACAIETRNGDISIFISNRKKKSSKASFSLPKNPEKPFRMYVFDINDPPINEFGDLQNYSCLVDAKSDVLNCELNPESVIVLTTDYIEKKKKVTAKIIKNEKGILSWAPVSDKNHAYYRVFRDNIQINSTIAEHIKIDEPGNYEVVSVDKSGNA